MKLLPVVLLLVLLTFSFAQVAQMETTVQADQVASTVPTASSGFDFSKNSFLKNSLISDQNKVDYVVDSNDIRKASISKNGFELMNVKTLNNISGQKLHNGVLTPIFSDPKLFYYDIVQTFTPDYPYSYATGDFTGTADGSCVPSSISFYNVSNMTAIVPSSHYVENDTTYIDVNGTQRTIYGTMAVNDGNQNVLVDTSTWLPIEQLTMPAYTTVQIKQHFVRSNAMQECDLIPRTGGVLQSQLGILSAWAYNASINVTTGICKSINNTPVAINISLTNSTLFNFTGENIAFSDKANQTQLYDYINPNTNNTVNGTVWVNGNWTGNANCNFNDSITVYAGNTASNQSNANATFNTSKFMSVYLFEYDPTVTTNGFIDTLNRHNGNNSGFSSSNIRTGIHGHGINFNSNQYAYLGTVPDFSNSTLTIAMTFVTNGTSYAINAGGQENYLVRAEDGVFAYCGFGYDVVNSINGFFTSVNSIPAKTDDWTNVTNRTRMAYAYNSTNTYYYRNGTFINGQTGFAHTCAFGKPNLGWAVGRDGDGTSSFMTNKTIDEMFVLNYNLSSDELTALQSVNLTNTAPVFPTNANATTMSSVGTGVNPIYYNSPIAWNATASTSLGTFQGFNCTLNVSNTLTPFNYVCNGGFCGNLTVYGVLNSSPSQYTIGQTLALICSAYSTNNFANSSNLTSSTYTVVDDVPLLKNLLIVANSTTGTIYPNATINGNLTVEDNDTSQAVTAYFSWYKNTVNQTSLAGTLTMFNGTLNTTPLNCLSVGCVAGDSWIFGVQLNDTLNWTGNYNTTATIITGVLTNITTNTSPIQYDLIAYGHGLNFTSPGTTLTYVQLTVGSITASSIANSSSSGIFQLNATVEPPNVFVNTTVTATWTYNLTLANGTVQQNTTTYTLTDLSSGLLNCSTSNTTNLTNTTSINYSFFDQTTLAQITATGAFGYTTLRPDGGSNKVTSITGTNNNISTCILPFYLNASVIASESANASGYNGVSFTRPSQVYTNASIYRPIFLINTSASTSVLIYVKSTNQVPFFNYTVILYRYYPATNLYNLSSIGQTDSTGLYVATVEPVPVQYAVAVLDTAGVLQTNITSPLVSFCGAVAPADKCTYNIYLGVGPLNAYGTISNVFQNGGTQTIVNTTSGSNNIQITSGPYCSFNNNTMVLTCTYTNDATNPEYSGLNLTGRNGSINNRTVFATNQSISGKPTSVSIYIPNITGVYPYSFFSIYLNTSNSTTFPYNLQLENGQVIVNIPTPNPYGADGWFMAMLIVIAASFTILANPSVMIISMTGAIELCAILGLITLSGPTMVGLLMVGLFLANWVKQ